MGENVQKKRVSSTGLVCPVATCKNRWIDFRGNLDFHTFPGADWERCLLWKKLCGRDDQKFAHLDLIQLSRQRICGQHFSKKQYNNPNLRHNLVWRAYPDVNLPPHINVRETIIATVPPISKLFRPLIALQDQPVEMMPLVPMAPKPPKPAMPFHGKHYRPVVKTAGNHQTSAKDNDSASDSTLSAGSDAASDATLSATETNEQEADDPNMTRYNLQNAKLMSGEIKPAGAKLVRVNLNNAQVVLGESSRKAKEDIPVVVHSNRKAPLGPVVNVHKLNSETEVWKLNLANKYVKEVTEILPPPPRTILISQFSVKNKGFDHGIGRKPHFPKILYLKKNWRRDALYYQYEYRRWRSKAITLQNRLSQLSNKNGVNWMVYNLDKLHAPGVLAMELIVKANKRLPASTSDNIKEFMNHILSHLFSEYCETCELFKAFDMTVFGSSRRRVNAEPEIKRKRKAPEMKISAAKKPKMAGKENRPDVNVMVKSEPTHVNADMATLETTLEDFVTDVDGNQVPAENFDNSLPNIKAEEMSAADLSEDDELEGFESQEATEPSEPTGKEKSVVKEKKQPKTPQKKDGPSEEALNKKEFLIWSEDGYKVVYKERDGVISLDENAENRWNTKLKDMAKLDHDYLKGKKPRKPRKKRPKAPKEKKEQVVCEQCGKTFLNQAGYSVHMRLIHGAVWTARHGLKRKLREYKQCPTCGIMVKNLAPHQNKVHGKQELITCPVCQKVIKGKANMKRHMRTHSGAKTCHDCGFVSASEEGLILHQRKKHRGQARCSKCKKVFVSDFFFQRHVEGCGITIGPSKDPAQCTCHICGLVSSNKYIHNKHVKSHETKPHKTCPHCGLMFVNMTTHMRSVHSNVRIPCPVCSKPQKNKEYLRRHMLSHSGTRYCAECGQKCSSASALDNHMIVAHRAIHPCQHCGIKYVIKQNRDKHMATCTGRGRKRKVRKRKNPVIEEFITHVENDGRGQSYEYDATDYMYEDSEEDETEDARNYRGPNVVAITQYDAQDGVSPAHENYAASQALISHYPYLAESQARTAGKQRRVHYEEAVEVVQVDVDWEEDEYPEASSPRGIRRRRGGKAGASPQGRATGGKYGPQRGVGGAAYGQQSSPGDKYSPQRRQHRTTGGKWGPSGGKYPPAMLGSRYTRDN